MSPCWTIVIDFYAATQEKRAASVRRGGILLILGVFMPRRKKNPLHSCVVAPGILFLRLKPPFEALSGANGISLHLRGLEMKGFQYFCNLKQKEYVLFSNAPYAGSSSLCSTQVYK